jgi:hypothetical protein
MLSIIHSSMMVARDAGRPVQQRVAHGAADLVERRVGLGDIDQAAPGLVQRKALRLD